MSLIRQRFRVGRARRAVCLAAAGLLVGPSAAPAAITHQYTFNDGTANDSAGGAHGTLNGGPAFVTTAFNGAIDLDGADDYVSLPGGTIAINTYTAVTLEGWFTIDATPDWQRLYDFGNTNASNQGANYIFYSPTAGGSVHRAAISDTDPGFNSEDLANGGPTLATGQQHHIAVTIANGGDMTLYRNGVQVGNVTLTKSLATVSNAFALLGESLYPGDANFNGRIDEFRIYNTALSAAQVQQSYNVGQTFNSTLVLDVNTLTGAMSLRNSTGTALPVDAYTIRSTAGAINLAGWNSLNDQNVDAVGAGAGQSWDEAGGSSANGIGEVFLRGSSSIAPGGTRILGNSFSIGGAQDLVFEFSLTDGTIARSPVNYISSTVDANFNNDPLVDGADVLILQRNLGMTTGATNAVGDTNGDGAVNATDFTNFVSRFGQASASAAATAAPEPAALWQAVLAATGAASVWRRRRG